MSSTIKKTYTNDMGNDVFDSLVDFKAHGTLKKAAFEFIGS
jgi:hypothetical protein